MAATPAPSLSQAMTKKKNNALPLILVALGLIVAIGFAVLGYLESQRTETVTIFIRDVPYGQQITAEDLGTIELPLHRPEQLAGIRNAQAVVGQYAARSLGVNDLAQPAMLMPEPPGQPVYPNGKELAINMVPFPFATDTIGPITDRDLLNIGFNDSSGDPALCDAALSASQGNEPTTKQPQNSPAIPRAYACRLLAGVEILYIEGATAYIQLTPYQAQTLWALEASNLPLWGERFGLESDVAELGVLDRLDMGQVNATDLTAPVPTPQPTVEADSTIPGSTTDIPGSRP